MGQFRDHSWRSWGRGHIGCWGDWIKLTECKANAHCSARQQHPSLLPLLYTVLELLNDIPEGPSQKMTLTLSSLQMEGFWDSTMQDLVVASHMLISLFSLLGLLGTDPGGQSKYLLESLQPLVDKLQTDAILQWKETARLWKALSGWEPQQQRHQDTSFTIGSQKPSPVWTPK